MAQFAILKPVVAPARLDRLSLVAGVADPEHTLAEIFSGRSPHDVMALDLETKGNDPSDPGSEVVTVALADSRGSLAIDLRSSSPDTYAWLLRRLVEEQVPLVMHNAFFDLSYLIRDARRLGLSDAFNLRHCTYALYKLIATEDWPGFSWSLKAAQKDCLGWEETNEKELDLWLIRNGYVTSLKKAGEEVPAGYHWMPELGDGEGRWASPQKAEMWRAPHDVLGYYAALDTDSTYLFYTQVLLPAVQRFKALEFYTSPEVYGRYIRYMIEIKLRGLHVDQAGVEGWRDQLAEKETATIQAFFELPEIQSAVEARRAAALAEHEAKRPKQEYKNRKLGAEPPRFKRDGTESANWVKWKAKADAPMEERADWRRWVQVRAALEAAPASALLNLKSGPQRTWLFYEHLKFPVIIRTKKNIPATDKKALKGFGKPGEVLQSLAKVVKEKEYVAVCLAKYRPETQAIHPGFLLPGTSSGRLSGAGGLNAQQFPKSYQYLKHIKARPGYKLVEMDFEALESVIMTELSRDPSMLKIYGPNAKPNDIHLFTGAGLPKIGEKIRAAGYDPDNPTEAGIEAAKSACKKEREVAKTVNYASVYQVGPGTLSQTLTLAGIPTSIDEAKKILDAYWRLYAGVREYGRELERQWRLNEGWLLNGIGRPVCLTDDKLKDLGSKSVQSSGHDCLVLLIYFFMLELEQTDIEWYPWLELHDELIVEVREDQAERAARLLDGAALGRLNKALGGLIPLRGTAQVVDNLAEAKNLKPPKA